MSKFKINTVSIPKTVQGVSDYTSVDIRSFLVRTKYSLDLIQSEDNDNKALAKLLSPEFCRNQLIEIFYAQKRLVDMFKRITGASQDTMRTQFSLTTFPIIDAMVKVSFDYASPDTRFVLSILVYRFMKSLGCVYNESNVCYPNRSDITIRSVLAYDMTLNALSSVSVPNSLRGTVSATMLAEVFQQSHARMLSILRNTQQIDIAYTSVLARVKAVVTRQINEIYSADEIGFMNSAVFDKLRSNYNIVMEAMSQNTVRPISSSLYWNHHDDLVNDALSNLDDFVITDDYRKFISAYALRTLNSSALAGVILGLNEQIANTAVSVTGYERINTVEYYPISFMQDIDRLVHRWVSLNPGLNTVRELIGLSSPHVNNNIKPFILDVSSISDIDFNMLATSYTGKVGFTKEGQPIWVLDLKGNILTYIPDRIVSVTTDPFMVILNMHNNDYEGNMHIDSLLLNGNVNMTRFSKMLPMRKVKLNRDLSPFTFNIDFGLGLVKVIDKSSASDILGVSFSSYQHILVDDNAISMTVSALSIFDIIQKVLVHLNLKDHLLSFAVYTQNVKHILRLVDHIKDETVFKSFLYSYRQYIITNAIDGKGSANDALLAIRDGSIYANKTANDQLQFAAILKLLMIYGLLDAKSAEMLMNALSDQLFRGSDVIAAINYDSQE